ncbi:phospholipase A2-like [Eupeodes corollae]|uniref:phospholipase A2-like n=1 Tax=Eupeodes corollae TaxID=290404 RepID=UPI002490CDFF|nr:phospholipase A2-like [Eupeodes corollae]
MNYFIGITLLLTANLMLVDLASIENRVPDIVSLLPLPTMPPVVSSIFPGTSNWCGIGVSPPTALTAMGPLNATDSCCLAHQQCEEVIEPIGTLHTLENPSLIKKFSCQCEEDLLNCLKETNDTPSNIFGEAYFGLVDKCFAEEHPVVECVEYQSGPLGAGKRCVNYKFNETQPKMYQYFDVPYYSFALG